MLTVLKKRSHFLVAGVSALLMIVMLGGCSLFSGEPREGAQRTHHDAASALTALPHVVSAEVMTSYEGTPNQVTLIVRLSAEPLFAADPALLLDYALAQGWSATQRKPTTEVRLDLSIEGQSLDLEAIGARAGVTGNVSASNKYDPSLHITMDDMEAAYGQWPGQLPEPHVTLTKP